MAFYNSFKTTALFNFISLELNPIHPFIYKVIYGEILFDLNVDEETIENFKHALEHNPETQGARPKLAACYA